MLCFLMQLDSPANHCFVCGPDNPIGLKVKFRLEKEDEILLCRAEFTPQEVHCGYNSMTHGGIVYSLLDDVMANYHYLQGQVVVTARMSVRYAASLPVGTAVALQARMVESKRRLAIMRASARTLEENLLIATAEGRPMRHSYRREW